MRFPALWHVATAGLFALITASGSSDIATAADLGGAVAESTDDDTYDYGDESYVAPNPVYVAVRGAAALPTDAIFATETVRLPVEQDAGLGAGVAFGVDLEQTLNLTLMRLEAEVGYHQFSGGPVDASALTGFVSIYRDIGEFYQFRPFVGAGIGLAHVTLDGGAALDDSASGLAWHATAGIAMEWSERTSLEIGYRYTAVHDLEFTAGDGTTGDFDFGSHAIFAGLRFHL